MKISDIFDGIVYFIIIAIMGATVMGALDVGVYLFYGHSEKTMVVEVVKVNHYSVIGTEATTIYSADDTTLTIAGNHDFQPRTVYEIHYKSFRPLQWQKSWSHRLLSFEEVS